MDKKIDSRNINCKVPNSQNSVRKIVFVSPWYYKYGDYHLNGNGIEQQIIGISKVLLSLDFDVYILTRTKKQFIGVNDIHIIEIQTRKNDSIFSRIDYSINTARYIKKINPDVIHFTDIITSYAPSFLNYSKIYTVHTVPNKEMGLYRKRNSIAHFLILFILNKMETHILKKSDFIVVLNNDLIDYFSQFNSKIVSIPNGIDINSYKNCFEDNTILYAGRLSTLKNIEILIYAFSGIVESHPEYKLQIIGSGGDKERLQNIVRSLNLVPKVEFIENVPNRRLIDYLSKCTIFVLPSLFETFGIVIIEAMASSKPVIASNIPGPKDIITNGYDGILFDNNDALNLKKQLIKLIDEPELRNEIRLNAKETVKKYSFEEITDQYLNLYYAVKGRKNVKR